MNNTLKTYMIRSVGSEPDRDAVPLLEADRILWLPDCGVRAFGQFCYDPAFLYVRLRAVEKNIRAAYTAPLSPVHQDSCLEFFFMQEGDNCYFNFEINPNGCLHIGYGSGRQNRSVVSPTGPDPFGVRTEKIPDGWAASYRIPLSFLRLFRPDFALAGTLRANVYKCGDLTDQEHYLSWNPVTSAAPDFHRPQDFGIMTFE